MTSSPQGQLCDALYPLFIDLRGRSVVVVGAGEVAWRKVRTLLSYGACVRVVSPDCCPGMAELAEQGAIELVARAYKSGDLDGALLAVAATDDTTVNTAVYEDAQERSMLVNVVDVPELCNAYVPSVLRRGLLQIAVSTSGAAPSLARNVRRSLEQDFPAYWEDYVGVLAQVRLMVKERVAASSDKRAVLFEQLTDGRLLAEIAQGATPSAQDVYDRYIQPLVGCAVDPHTQEDVR